MPADGEEEEGRLSDARLRETFVERVFAYHRLKALFAGHWKAGDVVRFTNDDEFLHQIFVTSGSFKFDSAEQPPGQTIEVTFPTPGTYAVRCHIHPKMLLSVLVK